MKCNCEMKFCLGMQCDKYRFSDSRIQQLESRKFSRLVNDLCNSKLDVGIDLLKGSNKEREMLKWETSWSRR